MADVQRAKDTATADACRGYIETVTFPELGVVVICNEKGRLLGLPYCCTIRCVDFCGPVAVFRPDGENLADVQYKLREWKELVNA